LKRFNNDFSELTKNVSFLTQVHGLSPGSEIWDREKPIPDPDPGVKKALDTGSGSAMLKIYYYRDFLFLCCVQIRNAFMGRNSLTTCADTATRAASAARSTSYSLLEFRIRDILVRIRVRIHASVPLANGSGVYIIFFKDKKL